MTLTKIMFSAAASIMLASCGLIKDDVEPCSVTQRLSFTYEYNMLYKDLFRSTVSSLHLYAFDSEGILRWQKADAGEHLSEYGYDIDLNECPEGVYTFIVWGGKHDGIPTTSHFKLPDLIPGVSTITDLNCRMHREDYDGTIGMQNKDLSPLYYGKLDNVEIFSAENADRHISQRYKIDLMKDTNLITVVLENEDGTLADINEYRLSTMESNGLMDHNNTLLDDRDILFLPWHKNRDPGARRSKLQARNERDAGKNDHRTPCDRPQDMADRCGQRRQTGGENAILRNCPHDQRLLHETHV